MVQKAMPGMDSIDVVATASDDIRSYHISSEKIHRELGFVPNRTIEDAVKDLCQAFEKGKFKESMTNPFYYNIKRMQEIKLH